jgi:glycosyltransferase involved in cell wall biosynthesis
MPKEKSLENKYIYDVISISHFFYPTKGGMENMAYQLLNNLTFNKHKVLCVHGGGEKHKTYSLNDYTVRVFKTFNIFKNTYPIFGLKFFRYIHRLINNNPNAKILIHSRHLTSSFLAAFACVISGKQYILIEHTAQTSFVKTKLGRILIQIYEKTLSKFVVEKANKIVSVSSASRSYLLNTYNVEKEKIEIINNGIEEKELQKLLNIKKEKIVIFAGKLIKVKNPEITYNAFLKLAPKHPDWIFSFIGNGDFFKPKDNPHKNLIVKNAMLSKEKLMSLFAKSSIYINSSISEGLSLTILEATYLKNIPVLSDAESNYEIMKNLKTTNFTFKKDNQEELELKIENAMKLYDNKKALENIHKYTKTYYNNDKLFEKYLDLLFPKIKQTFKKLSIIIPAYNEEKTIAKVLDKIINLKINLKKEIIIVNDCSKDDTKYIAEVYSRSNKNLQCEFKILNNTKNLGKTQSVKKGLLNSTGDLVVIQDADLEYNPNDLKTFVNTFEKHPFIDFIYGNRFHHTRQEVIYQSYYLGNRFLTKISNLFTIPRGLKVNDMEVCYKMAKGEIFRNIGQTIESTSSFGLEPELTAKFAKKKAKDNINYWEIPIDYKPRTIGEGKKIKIVKDGSSALLEITKFNSFRS